jgi:hypothetical protein
VVVVVGMKRVFVMADVVVVVVQVRGIEVETQRDRKGRKYGERREVAERWKS